MIRAQVLLFDSSNIDEFQWPDNEDGRKGKDYLYPLIKEGVNSFLGNVVTKVFLVSYKDVFLPFTLNNKEYDNSYIASNYYALKFYEEQISKKHPVFHRIQKPFLFLGGKCLKLFKVNKTIFINNWLMTNSLAQKISNEELASIMEFLKKKFSSHTIIFRHVDVKMKKELLESLKENKFHLLKTREIYYYNPEDKAHHNADLKRVCRRDLKLFEKYNFTIARSEDIDENDYARILALYEMLYLEKYTKYSPRYTEKFLRTTHQKKTVTYVALKRDGVIEGFFSYFVYNNCMVSCLFGYDTSLPHSHEVYKALTRLVIQEAESLKLMINDGSGGDFHKSNRGLKPSSEYMGLYSSHLPLFRRLLWNSIAFLYKRFT